MKGFVIALMISVVGISACSNEIVADIESDKIENEVVVDEEIEYEILENEEYELNVGDTSRYIAHEYEVVDSGENHTVEREIGSNKYRVTVFNDTGVIFKNVFFGTMPVVEKIDTNLIEVFKRYGDGDNYSVFVDIEKELVSNALNVRQPAFIVNEKVLEVEEIDYKSYITFTSLFDVKASVDRYELKNSTNSNRSKNVIENVGYADDNTIEVEYLDVDDEVQSQEIKIVNSEENSYNDEYVLYVDGTGYTGYEYEVVDSGKNYTVEWEVDTNKYRVTMFNDSGVIFRDVFFGTSPIVNSIDSDLLEIFKGYGTGAYFSIFVDTEKGLVSKVLNVRQPVFVVNERVLNVEYVDDKVYATFTSLFDNRALVDKYELKNAYDINLVPDIEDVSYSDDTIVIKYLDFDSNLQSQKIKIVNSEEVIKERIVHNKDNEEVNKFLQYLNNEIPMYTESGSYMYFSDRVEDDTYLIVDDGYYYVFDIDGDGENEFTYTIDYPCTEIIKYDNLSDSFVLWLETDIWMKPLTTLQLYSYKGMTLELYGQYTIDERTHNVIDENGYIFGDEPDENGNDRIYYNINGKEVTEDEWKRDSKEFFELIDNRPDVLSYSDLLLY